MLKIEENELSMKLKEMKNAHEKLKDEVEELIESNLYLKVKKKSF